MKKYWKNFTILYSDTDKEGYIKVENVLAYMAETSSWHSDSLGQGFEDLSKDNYAWMLLQWEIEIRKYPRAKDIVRVGTWISSFDRFYATREFLVTDKDENILAKASSKWIFIDIEKRRPRRIPLIVQGKYSFIKEFNLPVDTGIGKFLCEMNKSEPIKVRNSDIDNNNHVNNIRYIEWMQEGFYGEITNKMKIHRLGIIYKKEIFLEDTIVSKYCINKDIDGRFEHVISVENQKNALGYSMWQDKELLV